MIHWCSAEGKALLLFITLGTFFLYLCFYIPFLPLKWPLIAAYAIFSACACRFTARGTKCSLFLRQPSCPTSATVQIPLVTPFSDSRTSNWSGTPTAPASWHSHKSTMKKVALVTGASSGVGYAVAEALVLSGMWNVIMTGPNLQRVLLARRRIQEKMMQQQKKVRAFDGSTLSDELGDVFVLETVDLSDERSVRNFASKILENQEKLPLSLVVHAAGTLSRKVHFSKLTTRWWSVEKMLATNALGPMLLSLLLVPVLQKTAKRTGTPSRIIHVASSCHAFLSWMSPLQSSVNSSSASSSFWCRTNPLHMIAGLCLGRAKQLQRPPPEGVMDSLVKPDFSSFFIRSPLFSFFHHSEKSNEDVVVPRTTFSSWSPFQFVMYYGLSKLCLIWNAQFLAKELERQYLESNRSVGRVLVACTHPGVSCSHLYRCLFPEWVLDNVCYYPSLLVGKTQCESAFSTLRAIDEDEDIFVNGGYYLCDGEHSQCRRHYWPFLSVETSLASGVSSSDALKKFRNCLSAHAQSEEERNCYLQWVSSLIPELQL